MCVLFVEPARVRRGPACPHIVPLRFYPSLILAPLPPVPISIWLWRVSAHRNSDRRADDDDDDDESVTSPLSAQLLDGGDKGETHTHTHSERERGREEQDRVRNTVVSATRAGDSVAGRPLAASHPPHPPFPNRPPAAGPPPRMFCAPGSFPRYTNQSPRRPHGH